MRILLAKPYGYCYGVSKAMDIALLAKKEHPEEKVHLVGAPVHNEDAISFLEAQGLVLLDGDFPSLEAKLEALPFGSVVVFSAHGHPFSFDAIAKKRNFKVYDGTCAFVKENLDSALKSFSPVIYVGAKGHAEKEAFLSNCKKAYFYDAKTGEGNWRDCPSSPTLICQTTLSGEEIEKAKRSIGESFPGFTFSKGRCTATKARQEKVASMSLEADATIVLGSKSSNNAAKLASIAAQNGPAFLCLDEKEVRQLDLTPYKTLLVCSSASTSKETVEATLAYLSSL